MIQAPAKSRVNHLILIGQASVYFGLLILSLRHFLIYPAHHYPLVAVIMLIGFLPSLVYKLLPVKFASYILVGNALALVSLVFVLLQEWALAGVFVLVPVFSLLFQTRKIYVLASIGAFVLNVVLALLFLYNSHSSAALVTLLDVLTVFIILVFIVYFVVRNLRGRFMAEARTLQTIMALAQSVEAKDSYTQGHSERVAFVGRLIADMLPELDSEVVYHCGRIHDVGKLSIPDSILLKEGNLTDEEFQVMKTHTTHGAKLCENLNTPKQIVLGVLHHHERWDGRGYPQGLRGENIPLIGRVLCIADSIDAMCSKRSYRDALKLEDVRTEIKRCSGTQFDPSLSSLLLSNWEDIEQYYHPISAASHIHRSSALNQPPLP